MVTGQKIADTAASGNYIGIPYAKLDCQAFVERVLKDAGLPIINYRGSNHMWRSLVYDRELIREAREIMPGMLVFKLAYDGGETRRGYHDDMGNAYHVGLYVGGDRVIHSTTGGVQWGKVGAFTHIAKIIDVDYENIIEVVETSGVPVAAQLLDIVSSLRKLADEMEGVLNTWL